mgnify:CR=1 FL=1
MRLVCGMTVSLILLLALVQGITEFLPISSSGHLVLIGHLGGNDQGTLVDIALHVGTLAAVLVYFWHDVRGMLLGGLDLLRGRSSAGGHLAVKVVAATVPVVVAGLVLTLFAPDLFRSVEIIAWTTISFGLLLYAADRWFPAARSMADLPYGDALIIGIAQVLALMPGTSRSGITMTAARFLGYTRPEAARFSLLLSIPTIAAAGLLLGYDLYRLENARLTRDALIAGVLAFFAALAAIALMMRWLRTASFTPFVIYRLILGFALLLYVYT